MTNSCMDCVLVSPEGEVFSGAVRHVQIPSFNGNMQVYPQHAAALIMLVPGVTSIVTAQGVAKNYVLLGGYAQIAANAVTILAEKVVPQSDWTAAQSAALVHDLEVAYNAAPADERDDIATMRSAASCLLQILPAKTVA